MTTLVKNIYLEDDYLVPLYMVPLNRPFFNIYLVCLFSFQTLWIINLAIGEIEEVVEGLKFILLLPLPLFYLTRVLMK